MARAGTRALLTAAIAAVLLAQGEGFYLPGVAPRKYVPGEQLMVKVNTLTSDLTPLQVCDSHRARCACDVARKRARLLGRGKGSGIGRVRVRHVNSALRARRVLAGVPDDEERQGEHRSLNTTWCPSASSRAGKTLNPKP